MTIKKETEIKDQASFFKQDAIEVAICYYEDEDGKKVYDIEHMQDEFEQKLKELQS
jgi:hypothetical protein